MKKILVLSLVLSLAACVGMSKVGPGDHVIKEKLRVALDKAWNRLDAPGLGKQEIWTTEGLPLDTLRFFVDIKDGEPLLELPARKEKQLPRFKSDMQSQQIVELIDFFFSNDGSTFKLNKLSPAAFAGVPGFRCEFAVVRKGDEVELKGVAYGSVSEGNLSLAIFSAPKVHYFAKVAPRAEQAMQSVLPIQRAGAAKPPG